MSDVAVSPQGFGQKYWWLPLVQGIAAIVLGFFFLTHPASTAIVVAALVGIYWFIEGVLDLVMMFVDHTAWGWKLFVGILGVVAGYIVLDAVANAPVMAALGLGAVYIWVLGFIGILVGIASIIRAFTGAGWVVGLMGVLSVVFGGILIANALVAATALPWVLGIAAIVFGIAGVWGAFRIKNA